MRRAPFRRHTRQTADRRRYYPPAPEEPPDNNAIVIGRNPEVPPRCDRSGDLGTTHYWHAGAAVGDWCLCGKRRRLAPWPAAPRVAGDGPLAAYWRS